MTGEIENFSAALLLGPFGGLVALAFAAGAVAGWGFCVATILRVTNKQISRLEKELTDEKVECARQIAELKQRLNIIEDRYTTGMERQLGQIRVSTNNVLGDE